MHNLTSLGASIWQKHKDNGTLSLPLRSSNIQDCHRSRCMGNYVFFKKLRNNEALALGHHMHTLQGNQLNLKAD